MLGSLFRGLAANPGRAAPLFDRLTAEARRTDWYVAGDVSDTINGRFAVLATVTALTLVRIERAGPAGEHISVALTERFIHVMESEHRELGISDPTLGKTVRKLVGMLARRTELWQSAVNAAGDWTEAARASLYGEGAVTPAALSASIALLKQFTQKLEAASLEDLEQGRIA